jgi:hypothetical protein
MTFSDRFSSWFFDALTEVTVYFGRMSVIQWCVMASCAVIFVFMCLKGTPIRR